MRDYIVPSGLLRAGDVVVDCGANVGEFTLGCARLGARVLAFEPDPVEYNALEANKQLHENIQTFNVALWNENCRLNLFDRNDSGDSSVFDCQDAAKCTGVQALRLDAVDEIESISQRIRLLKLEAEGAEPEVLEGAEGLLGRIDYISADLGAERGPEKQRTIRQVSRFLHDRGFVMVDFRFPRQIALFASENAVSDQMNQIA